VYESHSRVRWIVFFLNTRPGTMGDHPAARRGCLENSDLSMICRSSGGHAVFLQLASGGVIRYPMLECWHRRLAPCD
jgi:hypothetical protein